MTIAIGDTELNPKDMKPPGSVANGQNEGAAGQWMDLGGKVRTWLRGPV